MAATGATPISLYYSTTAGVSPTAGNLVAGELALNTFDGKLFYKDSAGVVQVIATKGTGTIGGSNTQVQYNSSGAFAGSANMTFDGTTLTTAGLNNTGTTVLGDATTDTVTVSGYMGIGGASNQNNQLYVTGTSVSVGITQNAIQTNWIPNSAGTTAINGVDSYIGAASGTFTTSNMRMFYAENPAKGAGHTIVNLHGLYIADQTQGTNNYGITSAVSSGTNKYNIYASGTANNYFSGTVLVKTNASRTIGTLTGDIQIEGSNAAAAQTIVRNTADSIEGRLVFGKSRGTTAGSVTAVTSGDFLGSTLFYGADGTAMVGAAAILAAVDGTVSTGIVPGRLTFNTANTSGVSTERMRLDSSGNLGLGVTPSAWASLKGFEIGAVGSGLTSNGAGDTQLLGGAYYNAGWKYANSTQAATRFSLSNGAFSWLTAATGTAGNAITFTQAMTLNASGNLGLGTTNPTSNGSTYKNLEIEGTSGGGGFFYSGDATAKSQFGYSGAAGGTIIGTLNTEPLILRVNSTERMRIDSSGNLLVGVTSATANGGVIQVSNGITFPATQVAATNANTLDDYEEGSFTPVIIGTTSSGTGTYTTQLGTYVKIGSQVTITATVVWTAHTGTGNMRLTGLPFTSYNNALLEWTNVPEFTGMTIPASTIPWVYIPGNAAYVGISTISTTTGASSPLAIDTNAGIYGITITYFV